jgi:hypothetical protein
MPRRRTWLLLCLLVAFAAPSAASGSAAVEDRESWIVRAEPLCHAAMVRGSRLPLMGLPQGMVRRAARVAASERRLIRELRAIGAPAGDAAKVKAMVDAHASSVRLLEQFAAAIQYGRPTAARLGMKYNASLRLAGTRFRAYGADTCARHVGR